MARTYHGNFSERLTALRDTIAALKGDIARVEQAPIPFDEAAARLAPLVDALAARWTPIVSDLAHPAMPSVEGILQAAASDAWTLSGVIASISREGMIGALTASLSSHYAGVDAASCIPLAERTARLEELNTKRFAAECAEERLICDARRAGMLLDRRGDADPRAVLSVLDEPSAA